MKLARLRKLGYHPRQICFSKTGAHSFTMQNIATALQETLQALYRKAIDADAALDELQQAQQGKFKAIFPQQSSFNVEAKRFGPYVNEVATEWSELQTEDDAVIKQKLPALVVKIEQLLTTINQFQASLRK